MNQDLINNFLFSGATLAYLDPGTGSLILQLVIGGIAAGLLAIKQFGSKIKAKLTRTPHEENNLEKSEEVPEAKKDHASQ